MFSGVFLLPLRMEMAHVQASQSAVVQTTLGNVSPLTSRCAADDSSLIPVVANRVCLYVEGEREGRDNESVDTGVDNVE